jgi:hypothetical protein
VIARNRVSHTHGPLGQADGIEIDGGGRNVFARNSIRDVRGNGISVGYGPAPYNVVRRNRIRGAGGDGVRVFKKAKHTLLTRNRASGAKDDGIDINNPKTKLTATRPGATETSVSRPFPG